MAFAKVTSLNISCHLPNGLFVVIIVECFSYQLFINWNNIFAPSKSIGKKPTSSIINTLYLAQ